MIDNETRQQVEASLFRMKDFESMWIDLKSMYEYLGFSDELTDAERIEEYKWIVKQLRKYMSSKQDGVLKQDSLIDMAYAIEDLIAKAKEYGNTRQEVVYNFLRDHWLYEVYDALVAWGQTDNNEGEDE